MSDDIPEDGWHQYDAMMQEADMAGTIEQQRAEIERLRELIRQNCHRGIVEMSEKMVKDYSPIERGELIEEIYRKDAEIERLRAICRDISDCCNTDPRLYQEPIDLVGVLRKVEDLAVSGYASIMDIDSDVAD